MGKQTNFLDSEDYRAPLRAWATARGRGEYGRIARALRMHSTLLSQVMSGRKRLTEDQACALAAYLGLSELEGDCLLKLVQRERAGTAALRQAFDRHLARIRAEATEVRHRVPAAQALTEDDRAKFYSSHQYGLVRLLTSIDRFRTVEAISSGWGLAPARARQILEFLVSRGLCRQERDGRFHRTEMNTHVEAGSPLSARHHQNWRVKALELHERLTPEDLAFTAPVSIAARDLPKIRARLLEAVAEVAKLVEASPAEEVAYLGIDWIRLRPARP